MTIEFQLRPGIVVPVMPFLTPEQKYDFSAVERQVTRYVNARVAGLFVLTTCGQAPFFSLEENKELAKVVINAAEGRVPVYVGIGRTKAEQPRYTQEMLEHAVTIRADAVVVLCPDYTPEEQLAFFKELDQAGFPVIAYSLKSEEKQLKRLEEIAALDSVIGMKVTIDIRNDANRDYFKQAVATGKPVLMGEDVVLYEGLELGAVGGVNAVANLAPTSLVALYRDFNTGHKNLARERQQRINDLLSTLYYGKDHQGNQFKAASAVQNAMFQVCGFGSPTRKSPDPTYSGLDELIISDALAMAGIFYDR